MDRQIQAPLDPQEMRTLRAGDYVKITGTIYTARDAAHKRMVAALDRGEPLPFDPVGQVIYYAGPCPAKPGAVIGSCGPTTSGRMDAYAPRLLELGLCGMIGKGERSQEVTDAIRKYGCVYLGATGGAGALLAQKIKSQKTIAYEDLGAEALRELTVQDFPAIVLIK